MADFEMKIVDGVRYRPEDVPKAAPEHKAVLEPESPKRASGSRAAKAKDESDDSDA